MDNLPQTVRDMVRHVGLKAAMALVNAYPGVIIKVPTGAREDGVMRARLIGIMGIGAAERFIEVYAAETLFIPRCAQALRDERNREIIKAYTEDFKSVQWIAMHYGLTERQVRTILKAIPGESVEGLKGKPVDDRQMGLF